MSERAERLNRCGKRSRSEKVYASTGKQPERLAAAMRTLNPSPQHRNRLVVYERAKYE